MLKNLILLSKTGIICLSVLVLVACNTKNKKPKEMNTPQKGTYAFDMAFLKKHTEAIELSAGEARVMVCPEYQGRVMTSTAKGEQGMSYGWINHELIKSGEVLPQINPVGGEERFWLGPEGGQFSIFFKEGSDFDFADWQTPASIDSEGFNLLKQSETSAEFEKSFDLVNYSNFKFELDVKRQVNLLSEERIKNELELDFSADVKPVAYETVNTLKNRGDFDWKKETGLLSVWLLGMFIPSDEVTIVIPYKTDAQSDYIVKDDYFGKIPADRLIVDNGIIFFKGDGKQRGKLGILPQRALPLLGSYDAINNMLTIVKCEIPENEFDYVNSAWEKQEFPYKGDAINSYNDGPLEDGSQMGPFYELETSSPALKLKAGESASYKQITMHFEGDEKQLDAICQKTLGVSLEQIKAAF